MRREHCGAVRVVGIECVFFIDIFVEPENAVGYLGAAMFGEIVLIAYHNSERLFQDLDERKSGSCLAFAQCLNPERCTVLTLRVISALREDVIASIEAWRHLLAYL